MSKSVLSDAARSAVIKAGHTDLTPTTNFSFTLDSFRITDTRSRHNDTDYVTFNVLVSGPGGTPTTHTRNKALGDVNNGTHSIAITYSPVAVSAQQTVTFNYLIVNSGHTSESKLYPVLEAAGSKLATAGFTAAGAAIGSAIPIPGLGTLIGAGAGWLVGELSGLAKADCDGPVAIEQEIFTYEDLIAKTAHGPYKKETPHAGGKSQDGCGGNSMYYVTWHIARV